jgi:hypothetical protein
VEVGSAFIAGGEAPELRGAEGAFDDVSDPAEAGSVGFATTCHAVLDAVNGNQPAVLVEVVSAVGVEGAGLVGWLRGVRVGQAESRRGRLQVSSGACTAVESCTHPGSADLPPGRRVVVMDLVVASQVKCA